MWAGRELAQSSLTPLVSWRLSPGHHVEQHDDGDDDQDGDDDGNHPGSDAGVTHWLVELECLIGAFPAHGVLNLLRIGGHGDSPLDEADESALGDRIVAGTVPRTMNREVERARSRGDRSGDATARFSRQCNRSRSLLAVTGSIMAMTSLADPRTGSSSINNAQRVPLVSVDRHDSA